MLHDPSRHEALQTIAWDEGRVRAAIQRVVSDTEQHFSPEVWWPNHPLDIEPGEDPAEPVTSLYYGACGVVWALQHLRALGAATLECPDLIAPDALLTDLLQRSRHWLATFGRTEPASYLMGETPILLLAQGVAPTTERADRLAALIAGNLDHPARELMWGAPGTLLAALFLHRRSGEARWADLFRQTAARLHSQLRWSAEHACHHWIQDLYGHHSSYLDAVHGFVATASPLINGRDLLAADDWAAWQACIVNTVQRTAEWEFGEDGEDGRANWRPMLDGPVGAARTRPLLMQFCHGAPGFVICLAGMPGSELDPLLLAAGEAIWHAGPLVKGSNLCHGTGGNGYAFLKLYRRSGDPLWLGRARAFAMHGLTQMEAEALQHGHLRYSLWTGDPGFAIYLWACITGDADFPTLDVFYG